MRFYFHEYAEAEFDRAVEYYEDCRHGLGIEFAQEVYATIDRIIQYPEAWSPMSKNTRRTLSTGAPLASFIKSNLAPYTSSQLPIFDVAQTTGWAGSEQNHLINLTVKACALPACYKSVLPI
jgi:hypothetical protein